jgi:hypothetical protein
MYTQKPLPSLPAKASTSSTTRNSILNSKAEPAEESGPVGRSSPDRLRVTCHHGPGSSEVHEVETTLDFVPTGPSQLEIYADDEQEHEMMALGLFRKTGQKRLGTDAVCRTHREPKRRRRCEKLDDASGHDPEGKGKGKGTERDSSPTSSSGSPSESM